tara:strand:+ start:35 stop:268 length:234 start_codon:yes stop_codon:yes gene_type:complete
VKKTVIIVMKYIYERTGVEIVVTYRPIIYIAVTSKVRGENSEKAHTRKRERKKRKEKKRKEKATYLGCYLDRGARRV